MLARTTVIVFFAASAAFAQSKTYEVRAGSQSTAQFHAEDSYDSFDGKTDRVSGTIVAVMVVFVLLHLTGVVGGSPH